MYAPTKDINNYWNKSKSTVSFLLRFSLNVFNIELNSQLKYYFPVSYRLLLGTTEILNEKPEFP